MFKGAKARLIAVSGAVVVLVVAGIVVATVGGDDGDAPAGKKQESKPDGALDELWHSAELPGWEADDLVTRMWTAEDTVVIVSTGGVWGFDADTGKRRWELELLHAASTPCAASETVNAEGIGVVLFSTELDGPAAVGRCGELAGAVDVASGELLWTEELPDFAGGTDPPRVTIGDKVVTVDPDTMYGPEYHFRFSLKGKKLSLPEIPGGECDDKKGWLQGRKYTLAMNPCELKIAAYDTQDGKKLWTGENTWEPFKIITEEPLTVTTSLPGGADMVSFDDGENEYRAEIELPRPGDGPRLVQEDVPTKRDTVLVTSVTDGGFVAVDLKSGEQYWRDTIPGMAVGTGDEYLLALAFSEPDFAKRTPGDYDCRLIRLDASTGKQHEEGILPCPAEPALGYNAMPVGALATDDFLFTVDIAKKSARVVAYKRP